MGFGKDGKGQILYDVTSITLGALGSLDCIQTAVQTNLTEDFRILKTEYFLAFSPGSADSQEGPIIVGMGAGGNSAAEIEECLEATPNDTYDSPEIEQVMRPVWPLEIFFTQGDNTTPVNGPITAKGEFTPRWTMPDSLGWSWWAYNLSSGALATGGVVNILAKHYGVWVR